MVSKFSCGDLHLVFLSQLINSNGPCTFFTIEFVDDRGGEEEAAIVGLEGDLLDRLLLLPFPL